jgi:primosomal protein N'
MNHLTSTITLNNQQTEALDRLKTFLLSDLNVFLLKGYAGTGKTTILTHFISQIQLQNLSFLLMAPTGRAANIIRQKTSQAATTIHKSIYSFNDLKEYKQINEKGEVLNIFLSLLIISTLLIRYSL